jgi:hypothetical protein
MADRDEFGQLSPRDSRRAEFSSRRDTVSSGDDGDRIHPARVAQAAPR